MKLEQLRHLVAIVAHGSLRAAARRLNIPQPALTRSVRALEREVGAALFVRETTGMVLTPVGQRFHLRASVMVNEARRALDEISQESGDAEGVVCAALSIMPHVGMLPYALPIFRRRYPKVMLQLIEGLFPDVESALRQGSIDFYLGAAPRTAPAAGLIVQPLFENTRAVVCRKGHPLAGATTLADLVDADWMTTAVDYGSTEDDMTRLFACHNLPPPRVKLRAHSAMSVIVGLAHSDLLAMLPVQWAAFPPTQDALQVITVRETLPAPVIVMIRRPDLPLTPAGEFLSDLLCRSGVSGEPAAAALRKNQKTSAAAQ
jgi:LysR family transcriptional regulator of abg operon